MLESHRLDEEDFVLPDGRITCEVFDRNIIYGSIEPFKARDVQLMRCTAEIRCEAIADRFPLVIRLWLRNVVEPRLLQFFKV